MPGSVSAPRLVTWGIDITPAPGEHLRCSIRGRGRYQPQALWGWLVGPGSPCRTRRRGLLKACPRPGPQNLEKTMVLATFWPRRGPRTFFFQALSVRVKRTHAPRSPALATPATSMVRLWASISTDRRAEGPPSALAPPFGAVPGVQCQVPTPVLTHLGETATCSSLEHRGLRFVR